LETFVVLGDEAASPEFVLETIEGLAGSAESPIISSGVACYLDPESYCVWLAIFTIAGEVQKFLTTVVKSLEQIQTRSNTHSHITLAKVRM
jgi:hypothetical protein